MQFVTKTRLEEFYEFIMEKFCLGYYSIGSSFKIFLSAPLKYQKNNTISPIALCMYLCNLATQATFKPM